ncbi:hypothetical protein [Nitrincola schmidtii]|uniref:hypothetical protein n=1 Tax=Nitrincola schmidtii TaxID=1730894 RepID=UPI00124BE87F|nr:hypothetical protein [Nitrincola schmidtii]
MNKIKYALALCVLSVSSTVNAFETFNTEQSIITELVKCSNPRVLPASQNSAALYGCIGGLGETVKIFINGNSGSNTIRNFRFMWNEYTTSSISGTSAAQDKDVAESWLLSVSERYFKSESNEIKNHFFNSTDNKKFTNDNYTIEYTFHRGPSINERLLTITKNN